jgi:hypothetical protein
MKIRGRFRIRGRKFSSFFSNLSPLFFLSHVYIFLWFSYYLLPHGRLNYPLLGLEHVVDAYVTLVRTILLFQWLLYFDFGLWFTYVWYVELNDELYVWVVTNASTCIEIDQIHVCMQNPRFEIKYRKKTSIAWSKPRLRKMISIDDLLPSGTQVWILLLSPLEDLTAWVYNPTNHKKIII